MPTVRKKSGASRKAVARGAKAQQKLGRKKTVKAKKKLGKVKKPPAPKKHTPTTPSKKTTKVEQLPSLPRSRDFPSTAFDRAFGSLDADPDDPFSPGPRSLMAGMGGRMFGDDVLWDLQETGGAAAGSRAR